MQRHRSTVQRLFCLQVAARCPRIQVAVEDISPWRGTILGAGSSTQEMLPFTDLDHPIDVAVDSTGALYVSDSGNNRVLKLAAGSTPHSKRCRSLVFTVPSAWPWTTLTPYTSATHKQQDAEARGGLVHPRSHALHRHQPSHWCCRRQSWEPLPPRRRRKPSARTPDPLGLGIDRSII